MVVRGERPEVLAEIVFVKLLQSTTDTAWRKAVGSYLEMGGRVVTPGLVDGGTGRWMFEEEW